MNPTGNPGIPVRRLGRTGYPVSSISLGTVELGMDYGMSSNSPDRPPPLEQACDLLNRALDAGVNLIDTARSYGESEAIIGSSLGKRRSEYFLATKLDPDAHQGRAGRALRTGVAASVHQSLRELQTDTIDLMYIHHTTLEVIRAGEVLEALRDLRRQGLIRWIGASTYGVEPVSAALGDGGYDVIQIAHNLCDRRHEPGLLTKAQAQDVGVVVRSVLLKGALTPRYKRLPDALAPLRSAAARLEALAQSIGASLAELAVRYGLHGDAVSSVLVGTASWTELAETIAWSAKGPLPPEVITEIRSLTVTEQDMLYAFNWPAF